ncbi:MAG: sodium:proline symporter, partial [Lachnospiraceae bacterium]|nr:sodium:proline symporter [Lachnospiraceae bacterium]
GMLSGGIMVFLWKYLVRPLGGFLNLYELAPAFLVSILFVILVSLLTPAPDRKIVEDFEAVKKEL